MCAFCSFSFKLVRSIVIKLWYLYSPWNSPGQNTGVGSLSPLQGILPTQGSNPGLPHCRWILYQLSHKGSLRILEWAACSFSSGSSWPRNGTGVSCIAGRFFTNWGMREALLNLAGLQFKNYDIYLAMLGSSFQKTSRQESYHIGSGNWLWPLWGSRTAFIQRGRKQFSWTSGDTLQCP